MNTVAPSSAKAFAMAPPIVPDAPEAYL